MSRSSVAQAAVGSQPAAGSPDTVGRVQSHGVVLVLREPDARIVQASAHAGAWLGQPLDGLLLGPVERLGGDLAKRLRELTAHGEPAVSDAPLALACTIQPAGAPRPVEAWVHRVGPELLAVDLLAPASAADVSGGPPGAPAQAADLLEHLEDAIHALSQAHTLDELAAQAARRVRVLCGHEEVRILRFGRDGQPACIVAANRCSEAVSAAPAAAADWPADLHAQPHGLVPPVPGGVEVVVDTWAEPVSLLPQHLPGPAGQAAAEAVVTGSTLCAPEAARLARLRQAGVRAQASATLQREGRPWGAIVCLDSRTPRPLAAECRYAFGLLVEAVATRITAIESAGRAEVAEQVRRLQDLLVEATTHEGDWRAALLRQPQVLLEPLQATGAALLHDGEALWLGDWHDTPSPQALARWIDTRAAASVWCSDDLAADGPAPGIPSHAGTRLLAARLSVRQPDFLVWVRQAHPPEAAAPPAAWSATDLARAASFAEMLVDLMVQADAVRLLVTDRQLGRLQAKVSHSREAVVVCDGQGAVTLANVAFGELTGRPTAGLRTLEDVLALFTPAVVARRLAGQVRAEQRSARSVLALPRPDGSVLPVAVRAEPVLARSGGLMGTILLVEDLTAARLAEAAWTQLQGLLVTATAEGASLEADPVVSAIHTHASLAAMDMADTTRTPGLAPLLREVESATQRAIALYRRLSGMLRRR